MGDGGSDRIRWRARGRPLVWVASSTTLGHQGQVDWMSVMDVAIPFLICFILLGVGVSLTFNLFGVREFFTGQGSPLSEWRHVR